MTGIPRSSAETLSRPFPHGGKDQRKSRVVVLDLDGTITYKDTFLPFVIGFFLRRPKLRPALFLLPVSIALYLLGRRSAAALKQHFLRAFLGGAPVDSVRAWAKTFARRVALHGCRPHMIARIEELKRERARLILLTASPSVYVQEIANELGIPEVLSTEVEMGQDVFSGRVLGENCKGAEKLRRLQQHLNGARHQTVIAYGDRSSDLPVLRWADEGWLVHGSACVPADRAETRGAQTQQSRLRAHLAICRIDHWAKNVFVLPGAIVAYSLGHTAVDTAIIWSVLLGVFSVCLIASSNYVINEVLDAPFDRLHPTKHTRPAAQGLILLPLAYAQWIALMLVGMVLAWNVNRQFFGSMALLWLMGCIYNFPPLRTKDVVYLDVLSESINNPIRMLAGWYMMTATLIPPVSLLISYWMVGCYFMAIKRFSEYREIGNREVASAYRSSFGSYNDISLLVSIIFYASAGMLFFGAFIIRYRMELVLSFPLIALVMAIYLQIAFKPGSSVQNPEFLYKEPSLMMAVILCAVAMFSLLNYDLPFLYKLFPPTLPTAHGIG